MSDLLARLIADGTAPDLVAEVAMLLAEKQLASKALDDRRAKDRDRQNRRRSRDVTECHVTECDNADEPSPSLSSPQTPQQTHPHPDTKPRARKGASIPAKPDDVNPQVWADFLTHRKEKDAPVTETVIAGYRAEAAKAGVTLQSAMETSITQGWQGFRASWLKDEIKAKSANGSGPTDPLVASILARKSREASAAPP